MTSSTAGAPAKAAPAVPTYRIEKDPEAGIILATIERGDESVTIELFPPELRKHRAWGGEMSRHSRMLDTLYKAKARFENGQADYKNATRNLEHLWAEIDKAEDAMQRVYRSFLPIYAGFKKEACYAVEKLFDGQGSLMVEFVLAGFAACELTEDERKNYSRAPSAPSPPAPPPTAEPAKPSSPTPTEESTDPDSKEKK